jgi:hypothetical protein
LRAGEREIEEAEGKSAASEGADLEKAAARERPGAERLDGGMHGIVRHGIEMHGEGLHYVVWAAGAAAA